MRTKALKILDNYKSNSNAAMDLALAMGKTHLTMRVDMDHLPYIFKEGAMISGKKALEKYGQKLVYDKTWDEYVYVGEGIKAASAEADFGRFSFDNIFTLAVDKRYNWKIQSNKDVILYFDLSLINRADAAVSPNWASRDDHGVKFKSDPVTFFKHLYNGVTHEVTFQKKIPLKNFLRAIVVRKVNRTAPRNENPDHHYVPYIDVLNQLNALKISPPDGFARWSDLLIESKDYFVDL